MSTALFERRQQVFGRGAHLFYKEPLTIVRGEGVHLFDESGQRFVDMYNNVPCIGHCHPHLVEAINTQVATLNVHNRYLHDGILSYAERLVATHHDGIESIVMSCTGTEANEVAMLMARTLTEGEGFICTNAAYHGNSAAVRQLTRARDSRLIRSIPFPESYRCDEPDKQKYFLDRVGEQLHAFKGDGVKLAGLLICSLCANEGLPNIPHGFMRDAAEMVRNAGGVVIADEVQAGLGRSGNWWGYEASDFVPDIVTMGKPLGAGVPLAATASSREYVEKFRLGSGYFNTFASSPLQAAAGNAVLDVFESEQLVRNSAEVGAYLAGQLETINHRVDQVGDTRHKGLFVAIEWVESRETKKPDRDGAVRIVNELKDRGFLIGNAGAFGNVLKLRPPLVFAKEHADQFLDAYSDAVNF
ncbi:MAG: aminotransferase class III-fold pyridoxal phosphate-dependent enzyme [Gammaproteobacteria bacterium]|nr:aminotransferase class III-fold pyridoxal phosphate-dependent enzyme [Gammaproteobacteria bacterium]